MGRQMPVLRDNDPVRDVNFDVTYQDEDLVTEGSGAEIKITHTLCADFWLFHFTPNHNCMKFAF